MSIIKVYGASDDLVEVDGPGGDEFNPRDGQPYYLLFSDGTQLKIVYGGGSGEWEISVVATGTARLAHFSGHDSDGDRPPAHHDPYVPSYSDLVTLDAPDLRLVKHGHRKLKAPPVDGSMERAKEVIAYLEGFDGFEFFSHELGTDRWNDLMDGLAKLLAGKVVPKQLTFVITGTLSKSRADFVDLIEAAGHRVASSVNATTSYLLVGECPGDKLLQAAEHGISTIRENQLNTILNP